MTAWHEQFIMEARELIAQATDDLLALDREGSTPERIERVYRAFHTLKGAAGIVDLRAMIVVLHAAEDVLSEMHDGRLEASSAVLDQALACLDRVSGWVDDFEQQNALPAAAAQDARTLAEGLRAFLGAHGARKDNQYGRLAAPPVDDALPNWVSELISHERTRILRLPGEQETGLSAICYTPHAGCFFDGDDPLQLMRQMPEVLACRIEPREAWPPLADLDPYACNICVHAISAAGRGELAHLFRAVPDQIRIIDIPSDALSVDPAAVGEDRTELIRSVIEEQQQLLRAANHGEDFIGRLGATARAAANAFRDGLRADLAEHIELAHDAAMSTGDTAVLQSTLDNALELFLRAAAPRTTDPVPALDESRPSETIHPVQRSLRVDEARINALVNLAGELIVAKNSVVHLAKVLEEALKGHELATEVRQQHDGVARLIGEMHAGVLRLRMVPIAQVFRSFPRLVRDMSKRLNKKVELVMRGETAEADKTIVDHLLEPMLHLLRNALDHGIETPEQRRAAGKEDFGTITIQAVGKGDRFIVEVDDNGRGIDPALIRRKARDRKLMTEQQLIALSDEQAIDLVFAVGLSTAAELSEVSGRGIGMDAVRTAVERIGGRVSIFSRVGVGTTARLDLPITIAVARVMVVEAGGEMFGIPMEAVTETLRLTADRICQIKNNKGFVWRDRVVPICSLAELMSLPHRGQSTGAAKLLIVAEANGKVAGFEVDAIGDRLDIVLKPMPGVLAGAVAYSGTTVLGDGRVLLILNLKDFLL